MPVNAVRAAARNSAPDTGCFVADVAEVMARQDSGVTAIAGRRGVQGAGATSGRGRRLLHAVVAFPTHSITSGFSELADRWLSSSCV